MLNVAGSREQVSDCGFARYVETASPEARSKLRQLDISRCMLSQHVLVIMQALTGISEIFLNDSPEKPCPCFVRFLILYQIFVSSQG